MSGFRELDELIDRLRRLSEGAYCDYSQKLNRDECLGAEAKIDLHQFSNSELKAHCAAAEQLGRHKALFEAARLLQEAAKSQGTGLLP